MSAILAKEVTASGSATKESFQIEGKGTHKVDGFIVGFQCTVREDRAGERW
jgi:hypothetical protein